jgi:hypothetical protein
VDQPREACKLGDCNSCETLTWLSDAGAAEACREKTAIADRARAFVFIMGRGLGLLVLFLGQLRRGRAFGDETARTRTHSYTGMTGRCNYINWGPGTECPAPVPYFEISDMGGRDFDRTGNEFPGGAHTLATDRRGSVCVCVCVCVCLCVCGLASPAGARRCRPIAMDPARHALDVGESGAQLGGRESLVTSVAPILQAGAS